MMIIHRSGNIFNSKAQTLVNPVNCVGVMGAGLAKQFRVRYPDEMYWDYRLACRDERLVIGKPLLWKGCNNKGVEQWIVWFPTKRHYAFVSKIKWIVDGLVGLVELCKEQKVSSIALPPLGCGYGMLKIWEVRNLCEDILADLNIPIYLYNFIGKEEEICC